MRANPTYYTGDLRRELLDAALAVIVESGPPAVSLRALARGLNVSHAAPANHFASKEALFAELAREGYGMLDRALHDAGAAERDPVRGLGAMGLAYLEFTANYPGHFAIMFRRDLYDHATVQEQAHPAYAALVDGCAAAQATGWRKDDETRQLAALLWATVHGYAHLEAGGAELASPRTQLIALLDPGLLPAPPDPPLGV